MSEVSDPAHIADKSSTVVYNEHDPIVANIYPSKHSFRSLLNQKKYIRIKVGFPNIRAS